MATGTSFQRKTRVKVPQISGVKPSLQNNQLLVSTGVPSFDSVIGGGIAIGSVLLIEEDTYGSYSRLLLRYYLAESVLCKHAVHLSGADVPQDNLLQDLPGPVLDGPAQPPEHTASGESLKIAWRYQNQPQVQPGSVSSKFGHYYDLTKTMPAERLQEIDKTCFDATQINCSEQMDGQTERYGALLQSIQETIMKGGFSTSSAQEHRNILRIGIHSLGSPLWGENGGLGATGTTHDNALPRFLYALRALLRSAYATCMITMPTHLFHEAAFTWRVEKLCDTVVSLQSFVGSHREKNPVYKEYHGMFNVVSLPHLNSLVSHQPDTVDWAFKLRRKKFTIEKLHLPPELSETMSRPQEDPVQAKATGCGVASGTSKLDF